MNINRIKTDIRTLLDEEVARERELSRHQSATVEQWDKEETQVAIDKVNGRIERLDNALAALEDN